MSICWLRRVVLIYQNVRLLRGSDGMQFYLREVLLLLAPQLPDFTEQEVDDPQDDKRFTQGHEHPVATQVGKQPGQSANLVIGTISGIIINNNKILIKRQPLVYTRARRAAQKKKEEKD